MVGVNRMMPVSPSAVAVELVPSKPNPNPPDTENRSPRSNHAGCDNADDRARAWFGLKNFNWLVDNDVPGVPGSPFGPCGPVGPAGPAGPAAPFAPAGP